MKVIRLFDPAETDFDSFGVHKKVTKPSFKLKVTYGHVHSFRRIKDVSITPINSRTEDVNASVYPIEEGDTNGTKKN